MTDSAAGVCAYLIGVHLTDRYPLITEHHAQKLADDEMKPIYIMRFYVCLWQQHSTHDTQLIQSLSLDLSNSTMVVVLVFPAL